jgi:hypothetical protein
VSAARSEHPGDAQRRRDLARIHMAKAALKLGEDEYRDLLHTLTRERSAGALDHTGRQTVMAHLARLEQAHGIKPTRPAQPVKKSTAAKPDWQCPRYGKARKLFALLAAAGQVEHASDAAFHAWVKRQTQMEHWRFCTVPHRNTVIESLKDWCDRAGVARK